MNGHVEYWASFPPEDPLEAAQDFYQTSVPAILGILASEDPLEVVTLRFPSGDHTHREWRLAAVQQLARRAAPVRVNGIVGESEARIGETLAYLHRAPGVTGQLLSVEIG